MKIDVIEVEHLATFRSEMIGELTYHLVSFKANGKEMIATIHFDADDLWSFSSDDENYEPTEDDADELCACLVDSMLCDFERCKTLEEVKEEANATIKHYNNGAWNKLELNK